MSGWVTERSVDNRNEVHVMPRQDLIRHTTAGCACGTTTEPVEREDGSYGWLITHHSLDGREQTE
jgi:hypothetical protein